MKIALRNKIFYVLVCASLMVALAIGAQPLNSAKAAGPEVCNVTTSFIGGPGASIYKTLPDPIFTAQVNGPIGSITGTVMFYDDVDGAGPTLPVAISGAIPLAYVAPGISMASYTHYGLTVNGGAPHNIFAVYSGDANYCSSSSVAAPVLHTVAPVALTVNGTVLSPTTRVYNKTTNATFANTATLTGVIAPDVVTIATFGGTAANDDAGVRAVTPAFTLGGADGGNYFIGGYLPAGPYNLTITKKELHVTGITASNKVYTATTAATINTSGAQFVVGEVIPGDSCVLTTAGAVTGTFADKNVGTGKTVTIAGYTLSPAACTTNYMLAPITTTADITKAVITLVDPDGAGPLPADGGVVIAPRNYDTTNVVSTWAAPSWPLGAADGVLLADVVTLVNGSGTYNDANVGINKPVVGTGFTLGGADGGNYSLFAQPVGLKGTINIEATALCLKNPGPWTYNATSWTADLEARLVNCAGTVVPGSFSGVTYNGSATKPINVGVYAVDAAFTSPAPLNYPSVALAAAPNPIGNMTIVKYNPWLSITNSPVAFDGAQHAAILVAEMNNGTEFVTVPGTFTNVLYNGLATLPSATGIYAVTASFTPTDAVNYTAYVDVFVGNFVIGPAATLSITNSPVVYNGVSQAAVVVGSVPGTVWNVRYDGSFTVPTNAGTYAVTADFVPTDPTYITLYDAPAGNFVINKADMPAPTLVVTNSPVIYNGSGQSAVVEATSAIPGQVANVLTGGALFQTAVGTYPVTADFVPFDSNYNTLIGQPAGNFVINPRIAVELLLNGGFNSYTGTSMIPVDWTAMKFASTDGQSTTRVEGMYSVMMQGQYQRKALYQEILTSGVAGTPLTFTFAVKGENVPAAGICVGQVKLYNGSTLVQVRNILCGTGTYDWTWKTVNFNAFSDYTKVRVLFANFKASGDVWFDAVSFIK